MPRKPLPSGFFEMLHGGEPEEETYPMREAQNDMLDQLLKSAGEERAFKRGDRVHYFACSGPFAKKIAAGFVFMFWRWLDYSNPEDQSRITNTSEANMVTSPHLDCMIVYYDGKHFRFDLACSKLLVMGIGYDN